MKNRNSFHRLILIIFVIVIGRFVLLQYCWSSSEMIYAIAIVKGKRGGAGPSKHIYHYQINDMEYTGSSYDIHQGERYIVVLPSKRKSSSELITTMNIDFSEISPQPPGGWTECPIHEDGSIKEKYKRHKKKEQTEENQITGVEFSAQDSAQVTKSSVDFLKQHTNP